MQTVDCVSVGKRERQRIFTTAWYPHIRISAMLLLHIPATFRRRGITVPRKFFTCADYPNPAVVADWHRKTCCATRVCRACVELILCVAVRSPTLRIGCERHGRKNPLPFPYFAAVTCRQSAPDYPRERGDSQEGGNRRCLPSCAPAG